MTAAFADMSPSGPTLVFVAVLIVAASLTWLFLGQSGHFDAVGVRAGMDPHMSEGARSLQAQAKIANCLADEARRMLDAWAFDLRVSRGHASSDYVAGMERLISAVEHDVRVTEAWVDTARWAAADGVITAEERVALSSADSHMAAAATGVYDAYATTVAVSSTPQLGLVEPYLQALGLAGVETACY